MDGWRKSCLSRRPGWDRIDGDRPGQQRIQNAKGVNIMAKTKVIYRQVDDCYEERQKLAGIAEFVSRIVFSVIFQVLEWAVIAVYWTLRQFFKLLFKVFKMMIGKGAESGK
jgi:hypothetical protein